MYLYFVITHLSPVSEIVLRVEGASVDGAVMVVDIVRSLFSAVAIGDTVQVDIGSHGLVYAINADVVAVGAGSFLASYGGLVLQIDGGLSADTVPVPGSNLMASLCCVGSLGSNKRMCCAV
jgi:hypothetical protein